MPVRKTVVIIKSVYCSCRNMDMAQRTSHKLNIGTPTNYKTENTKNPIDDDASSINSMDVNTLCDDRVRQIIIVIKYISDSWTAQKALAK